MDAVRKALKLEGRLQILVVDDDSETRQLLCDVLTQEGYGTLAARSVGEAARILKTANVDAIVLDLMFPGRNGFDLLNDIRASEDLSQILVLALTVKDLSEREKEILASHSVPVFQKGAGWRSELLQRLRLLARTGRGMSVLVADDNEDSRELVREGLRGQVSAIIEAADGREALEKIRETRPDLVLLDIQMPEIDGYGVLREIRRDPALRNLRVVALTAFAMEGDREQALDAGFDDYLTKPVTVATLKAQIAALQPAV